MCLMLCKYSSVRIRRSWDGITQQRRVDHPGILVLFRKDASIPDLFLRCCLRVRWRDELVMDAPQVVKEQTDLFDFWQQQNTQEVEVVVELILVEL